MEYKFNFAKYKYFVSGVGGFTFDMALRLWKTKFNEYKDFHKEMANYAYTALIEFVKEVWDDIEPVTVEEAFKIDNQEVRRVYFDCIGVVKLFQSLEPELLDRQEIQKTRARWNDNNEYYQHNFTDVYELYKIDRKKLFSVSGFRNSDAIYAVRCWCTTTNREYWIYVPDGAAHSDNTDNGSDSWARFKPSGYVPDGKHDAISAIAWTIRIDVSNPKRIFRQGDIIVVEESADSKTVADYHLTKDQYLSLMYSET